MIFHVTVSGEHFTVQPLKKEMIYLLAFASQTPSPQHLQVAKIYLETKTGTKSVLFVPTIAAPLQNAVQSQLTQLPYLQGLTLAHPVTSEKEFKLSLQIITGTSSKITSSEEVDPQP